MNELFSPAMSMMDRLRFPGKFILLFIIVLIPLLTMATLLIKQFDEEANYLDGERKGLAYIKSLRMPLEHLQQHRGMTSAYKNGADQFKSRILSKRQDIDGYFNELVKIDGELSANLQTRGLVDNLISQWESIKAHSFEQDWPTTLKAHNGLIADMLSLFRHISNTSGIILDPKLDSYHLGSIVTEIFPQMIEFMGQTRATASGVAASGNLSPQTLPILLTLISNVDNYTKQLNDGLQAAYANNLAIGSHLNEVTDNQKRSLSNMLDMLQRQILNSNPITISSENVFNTSTEAITASYQLYNKLIEELDRLLVERSQLANQHLELTVLGSLLVLALDIYLLIGLSLSINRSVAAINIATKRLAGNDFTAQIGLSSNDEMHEISSSFNTMSQTLSAVIGKIINTSGDVQKSAKQVSDIAQKSAYAAERQRQETTSVAAAITEMSATIQEVANTTSQAADAAKHADAQANQSKTVVATATTSIRRLAEEIETAARVIQNLEADSKSIGTVLDVIKSIAEQTNLLALNAAIEAARAGEQGRGFAVVADEVRTLASRTQESTSLIENMIAKLQGGSRGAVTVMQQSCVHAQQAVKDAQNAMQMLEAITQSVATINTNNMQIASAADQQTAVTEEINRNIIHISDIAAQTSAGSEQTTVAANHLYHLADSLQALVNQFKIAR